MLENLHPKLVHFPIALILTAGVFDVLSLILKKESLHQAARYVFNLAAFFSVLAVISGLQEANHLQLNHPVLTSHRFYAIVLAVISILSVGVLFFLPKRFVRPVFFGMVLFCAILVIVVGHLGGQMVYEYGVGVAR